MEDAMKKEEKTELTRNKIFEAAIQEFSRNGYAAGSINNICKAGINKGLIYHNFKDKDDLYLQCVHRCCQNLMNYITEHMKQICFVEYMSSRLRFFTEHESEAVVFLEARTSPPSHLEEALRQIGAPLDEMNLHVFESELAECELRETISREDALHYFLMIQKIYNMEFAKEQNGKIMTREQLQLHEKNIRKVLDLLLYGIAKGGREER